LLENNQIFIQFNHIELGLTAKPVVQNASNISVTNNSEPTKEIVNENDVDALMAGIVFNFVWK
jgi:hypothetical protein